MIVFNCIPAPLFCDFACIHLWGELMVYFPLRGGALPSMPIGITAFEKIYVPKQIGAKILAHNMHN